ncbi:membrane protein [Photobacterium marinum]|uniref:Membrane protein n=1 Tax=Photobacterium marinum TaxID=1056511 RepID=L8JCM8_9GAMM|nr:porin [Photobacterium marinum]ELR65147.1 membrane protein [Photobacterium marinum]
MNKIFKRSVLGAAIATAAMVSASANAYQIGENNDFNVEVYGVAAISVVNYDTDETNLSTNVSKDASTGYDYENESRIGFRAGKDMFDNLNVFMQVESGYVGEDGEGATLGNRDTFIGMKGDWGKVRFGRMLTPMYELVDWPYANPGLGASWDFGGDVKFHRDRHGDMARYDSPSFGDFNFSLATGRGDKDVDGNNWYGASAHYRVADMVTFHVGLESESDRKLKDGSAAKWDWVDADKKPETAPVWSKVDKVDSTMADTFGYLVGFEASLPAGFGLAGAYKSGESDVVGGEKTDQDSFVIIGQYWNGPWGFKLGYTENFESETAGKKNNDEDSILSGQLMYSKNGFVPYLRIAQRDLKSANDDGQMIEKDTFVVRLGMEYGF